MDGTSWNQSARHSGDEGDNDSDFEEVYESQLVATQVAVVATQNQSQAELQPTQAAPTRTLPIDSVETVRCMICALNLTSKSIMERELHLNACLDAASLETKYDCPTCGKELTDYNEQRRMAHVNLCLDRLSRMAMQPFSTAATVADATQGDLATGTNTMDNSDQQLELYDCRICGQQLRLQDIEARSRHVKQCGQRFGLRATDMVVSATATATGSASAISSTSAMAEDETATQPQELQSSQTRSSGGNPDQRNAFAVMMASSTSRLTTMASSATTVVSNAFDVLMKSSRTESVAAQTTSATTSARAFWHTNTFNNSSNNSSNNTSGGNTKSHKRMRFSSTSTSTTTARRVGCPDFKRIIGTQPPFIVDGFKYASKALSSVYFLTHFHSDHYIGLQRSFDCGIIYCNQITSALVVQELGIDAKFVHPVPMNTPVDIRGVQVTFMDANHCPGAAIILFKLRSGATYLHTGDFRFHPKMWSYASLRPFVPATALQRDRDGDQADQVATATTVPVRMDGVYLDTTYADPKYTFPTQEASVQHALTLVDKHMSSSASGAGAGGDTRDRTLYLFGSYSIGKERLFMEVAQRYQRKVCVSKAKLKMIQTYAWPDAKMKLLTTEPAATNLHVVPMQELRLDHLIALHQKHRLRFHQIVAFRPTGWTFSRSNASMATCQSDPSGNVRVYGIPYSEHSSFAELCEFVRVLNPQLIIPTVNCHTDRSVKKQVDALRQSAFHGINNLFQPL